MEETRIEGLWDCVYCEKKKIKARFQECPYCGKARGIETIFYLPTDIKAATLTKEEAANTSNEPDWLCSFCGSYNNSRHNQCTRCGANKADRQSDYGMLHKLTGKIFKKR